MVIRVLVVDDHEGVRLALAAALAREPDFNVCGKAADGRAAVELARTTEPHVVLMDVAMPRMDGFAATEAILHERPDARVLMLSCLTDKGSVARATAAGASGYLAKGMDSSDVAAAIRAVYRGERPNRCVCEPEI